MNRSEKTSWTGKKKTVVNVYDVRKAVWEHGNNETLFVPGRRLIILEKDRLARRKEGKRKLRSVVIQFCASVPYLGGSCLVEVNRDDL